MLVIVGLSALLGAAIADATSSARAAHPPTETMRVRLSPLGADRRDVPLSDHGRRGGAALNWLPVRRGPDARHAAANMAFTNRAHDTRLEHQERADGAAAGFGDTSCPSSQPSSSASSSRSGAVAIPMAASPIP